MSAGGRGGGERGGSGNQGGGGSGRDTKGSGGMGGDAHLGGLLQSMPGWFGNRRWGGEPLPQQGMPMGMGAGGGMGQTPPPPVPGYQQMMMPGHQLSVMPGYGINTPGYGYFGPQGPMAQPGQPGIPGQPPIPGAPPKQLGPGMGNPATAMMAPRPMLGQGMMTRRPGY